MLYKGGSPLFRPTHLSKPHEGRAKSWTFPTSAYRGILLTETPHHILDISDEAARQSVRFRFYTFCVTQLGTRSSGESGANLTDTQMTRVGVIVGNPALTTDGAREFQVHAPAILNRGDDVFALAGCPEGQIYLKPPAKTAQERVFEGMTVDELEEPQTDGLWKGDRLLSVVLNPSQHVREFADLARNKFLAHFLPLWNNGSWVENEDGELKFTAGPVTDSETLKTNDELRQLREAYWLMPQGYPEKLNEDRVFIEQFVDSGNFMKCDPGAWISCFNKLANLSEAGHLYMLHRAHKLFTECHSLNPDNKGCSKEVLTKRRTETRAALIRFVEISSRKKTSKRFLDPIAKEAVFALSRMTAKNYSQEYSSLVYGEVEASRSTKTVIQSYCPTNNSTGKFDNVAWVSIVLGLGHVWADDLDPPTPEELEDRWAKWALSPSRARMEAPDSDKEAVKHLGQALELLRNALDHQGPPMRSNEDTVEAVRTVVVFSSLALGRACKRLEGLEALEKKAKGKIDLAPQKLNSVIMLEIARDLLDASVHNSIFKTLMEGLQILSIHMMDMVRRGFQTEMTKYCLFPERKSAGTSVDTGGASAGGMHDNVSGNEAPDLAEEANGSNDIESTSPEPDKRAQFHHMLSFFRLLCFPPRAISNVLRQSDPLNFMLVAPSNKHGTMLDIGSLLLAAADSAGTHTPYTATPVPYSRDAQNGSPSLAYLYDGHADLTRTRELAEMIKDAFKPAPTSGGNGTLVSLSQAILSAIDQGTNPAHAIKTFMEQKMKFNGCCVHCEVALAALILHAQPDLLADGVEPGDFMGDPAILEFLKFVDIKTLSVSKKCCPFCFLALTIINKNLKGDKFPIAAYHQGLWAIDVPTILPLKILEEMANAMQLMLGSMILEKSKTSKLSDDLLLRRATSNDSSGSSGASSSSSTGFDAKLDGGIHVPSSPPSSPASDLHGGIHQSNTEMISTDSEDDD